MVQVRFGQQIEALDPAALRLAVDRTAVAVGVMRVQDLGEERPVPLPLNRLARGQGHGAVGPAVEGAEEPDDLLPPGSQTRQLHRGLDRLRTRVGQEHPLAPAHRRDRAQLLAQLDIDGIEEVGVADVHQPAGLLLHRLDDLGVAVSGRDGRDPRREIEEAVPIDVLDDHALPARHHQGHVLGKVLGHRPGVPGDQLLGLRPRQGGDDLRVVSRVVGRKRRSGHVVSPRELPVTPREAVILADRPAGVKERPRGRGRVGRRAAASGRRPRAATGRPGRGHAGRPPADRSRPPCGRGARRGGRATG